jgi:glycosyltransferase involved in cell wall biosynthesis
MGGPLFPHAGAAPAPAIALVDPVGDAGIGAYTHELAQALAGAGARVSVYTRASPFTQGLARDYRLVPVLDCAPDQLARRLDDVEAAAAPAPAPTGVPGICALDPYFDLLERRSRATASSAPAPPAAPAPREQPGSSPAAQRRASAFVQHLRERRYDLVWTQWPVLAGFGRSFFRLARAARLPLVHTVHNVFPHERFPGDARLYAGAYENARALVVHSAACAAALAAAFPGSRARIVESRHGGYTIYPRVPGGRAHVRARLNVAPDQRLLLFFGGVRPYKNLDGLLQALADLPGDDRILAVAGYEWGYPDLVPGDRLGRTRREAARLGIHDRVRLLPGPFGLRQTAELFEAADDVVLPYRDSFGSGVLLLAMTFGKRILATRSGGMDEYVRDYPIHILLRGPEPAYIAEGLQIAVPEPGPAPVPAPLQDRLTWPSIVRELLEALPRHVLRRRREHPPRRARERSCA